MNRWITKVQLITQHIFKSRYMTPYAHLELHVILPLQVAMACNATWNVKVNGRGAYLTKEKLPDKFMNVECSLILVDGVDIITGAEEAIPYKNVIIEWEEEP